jgi:hypothetical protein
MKPQPCPMCGKKEPPAGGCSHIACPNRKPVTADAPAHSEGGRVPPRINDNH